MTILDIPDVDDFGGEKVTGQQVQAGDWMEMVDRMIAAFEAAGVDSGATIGSLRRAVLGGFTGSQQLSMPAGGSGNVGGEATLINLTVTGIPGTPPTANVARPDTDARLFWIYVAQSPVTVAFADGIVVGPPGPPSSSTTLTAGIYLAFGVNAGPNAAWFVQPISAPKAPVGTPFVWTANSSGAPNEYTSWATLHAAVAAAPIERRRVRVEATMESMTVPAGEWPIVGWQIEGFGDFSYVKPTMMIDEGAVLVLADIGLGLALNTFKNIRIENQSSTFGMQALDGVQTFLDFDNVTLGCSNNSVLLSVGTTMCIAYMRNNTTLGANSGSFCVELLEDAQVVAIAGSGTLVQSNAFRCVATRAALQLQLQSTSVVREDFDDFVVTVDREFEVLHQTQARNLGFDDTIFGGGVKDVQAAIVALYGLVSVLPPKTFIWHPGGVAGGNVYTSWATLLAAVNAESNPGDRNVEIRADATVPAGAYDCNGWRIRGSKLVATYGTRLSLTLAGATLISGTGVNQRLYIENLEVTQTGAAPIIDIPDSLLTIIETRDVVFTATNGSIFRFAGTVADVYFIFRGETALYPSAPGIGFDDATHPINYFVDLYDDARLDFLDAETIAGTLTVTMHSAAANPGANPSTNAPDLNKKARADLVAVNGPGGTGNVQTAVDYLDANKLASGGHVATSVSGRSANSTGALADIAATTNDTLLARIGNALVWTVITIGMIADGLITRAKLATGAALSIIGRSANSTGAVADISTTNGSDAVLRESSGVLGFGQIVAGGIASAAVTLAKLAAALQIGVDSTQIQTITSGTSATISDSARIVFVATGAGAFALTCPTLSTGRLVLIIKTTNDANAITLVRTGSELIQTVAANFVLPGSTFSNFLAWLLVDKTTSGGGGAVRRVINLLRAPRYKWMSQLAREYAADPTWITTNVPNLKGWWRADTVIAAGGFASQVTDKSGNGFHFTQGTGSKQAAHSTSNVLMNGRATLAPDGVDDGYVIASPGFGSMNGCTIISVVRDVALKAGTMFSIGNPGTDTQAMSVLQVSSGVLRLQFSNPGGTVSSVNYDGTAGFGSGITIGGGIGDTLAGGASVWTPRNRLGQPTNTPTATAAAASAIALQAVGLFANKAANGSYAQLTWAETVLVSGVITLDQYRKIELYLAGYYGQL